MEWNVIFCQQTQQRGGISPFREKICVSGRLEAGSLGRTKSQKAGRLGMFGLC